MKRRRLMLGLLAAFAGLAAADFATTRALVDARHSAVGEGNAVAAWVLAHYGWAGLAVFKAAMVALVAGIALLVSRQRPRLAPLLLGFACAASALTTAYSIGLMSGQQRLLGGPDGWGISEPRERRRTLARDGERIGDYLAAVRSIAEDLRTCRSSLREGLARLDQTEQARDPSWPDKLQAVFPPLKKREELLAASLVQNALARASEGSERQAVGERLAQEFRELFARDLPDLPSRTARARPEPPPGRTVQKPLPQAGPRWDSAPLLRT